VSGRIAIVGSGPAGMATALAARRAGFEATIYERYPEVKPAGNILNSGPPPQKVLELIGVDIEDLGAPAAVTFRRHDGRVRARVRLPQDVIDEYGGGFIGLLRPGLYARMLEALPEGVLKTGHEVTGFADRGDSVVVHLRDRADVEADVLVAKVTQQAYVTRLLFHRLPRPIRPLRDLLCDHTPILQKVVGEATPGQILTRLGELEEVEQRRVTAPSR
jgi:NADPH-dependent 2,4-dienoyl-CoA reductase/sulfur reductase-like enzyme